MRLTSRRTALRSARPTRVAVTAVLVSAGWLVIQAQIPAQQPAPTFRSAIDLFAIDAQVVDADGRPISRLSPESFEVLIGGTRRRVVSADYIQSTAPDGPVVTSTPSGRHVWPGSPTPGDGLGRVFILAFDLGSLSLADSRAVVSTSRSFIDRLQPSDMVGLYTFPVGPRMEATFNHAAVRAKVDTVAGSQQSLLGEFNLSPSEIVDINYENARDPSLVRRLSAGQLTSDDGTTVLRKVQTRECESAAAISGCTENILQEALNEGLYLEGRATESLNGLSSLVKLLSVYAGRKTLVMFSAGMTASDRPGGRPDMHDLAKMLGKDAAATNTTIYALQLQTSQSLAESAQTRKNNRVTPSNHGRDAMVQRRVMEEFAGASGGALMPVITGSGEYALTRVLRETSSHYLLGVEPRDSDRDGKLRDLRVKVSQSGTTVRSRRWVSIPPKPRQ